MSYLTLMEDLLCQFSYSKSVCLITLWLNEVRHSLAGWI